MAPPGPEIGKTQAFQLAQALDFGPELRLGTGIENIEGKSTLSLHRLARAQFIENGKSRDLPHGGMCPGAMEMQFVLAIHLAKFIFGEPECGKPSDKVR